MRRSSYSTRRGYAEEEKKRVDEEKKNIKEVLEYLTQHSIKWRPWNQSVGQFDTLIFFRHEDDGMEISPSHVGSSMERGKYFTELVCRYVHKGLNVVVQTLKRGVEGANEKIVKMLTESIQEHVSMQRQEKGRQRVGVYVQSLPVGVATEVMAAVISEAK